MKNQQEVTTLKAVSPLLFFLMLLVYGLFVHPVIFKGGMLPLEVLILMALSFSCIYLMYNGYSWETIQDNITKKVGESVPVLMILFSIGVLIGSWIVSGTIPMLIYYGISIIDPNWIYIFSFLICIIFSLLTGTSWGSAGTIGIVMIGVSQVYDANLAVTAAAVVGGSFFGDKMSPLSDTTNIASLATEVPLFDHIKSMIYTTGPSAIIAGLIYIIMSPAMMGSAPEKAVELSQITNTMTGLKKIFNFNLLLLLPLLVVIWGSVKKKPIVLTLLGSSWLAMLLAFGFQEFSFYDIFQSFNKGFSVDMAPTQGIDQEVLSILNRGGLYNLIEGITISILIFAFIGTLQVMNSIDVVIKSIMTRIKTPSQTIVAALTTTAFTNLTTSNQYATSFIIGEAYKKQFDKMKIPRKVLSRSIEDAGTMLENLVPWTPSGIFMASTLGVTVFEYAPYQFLSLINIIIAYTFAMTGIACFYNKNELKDEG
ncbi:MAG: Na+/H+ antiporter NhaC [Saprospiraceae bacterium]|nr:Na+/H+ antiporter NhaC [Bacteroidia bacterium]NNE14888.1 Na+/H+ antiporter NhaC [Saprospiraceae bacterium]NNL93642.1 Na+/H+ antiporter NhaC [Saprospiraceae bacterium]